MKIKPLNDNVVLRYVEKGEEVSESGIIVKRAIDQSKRDIVEGEVVALPDAPCTADYNEPDEPIIKVGDLVLFDKYQANEINRSESLVIVDMVGIKGIIL